jgi:hypothetical protein
MIHCHQRRMTEVRGMLQGAAPGTTSPMPGYNTPVGTPHHTAKSPAQDAGRSADYNRAHFDSVFNKQQDSGGMLHCVVCREVCSFAFVHIATRWPMAACVWQEFCTLPCGSYCSRHLCSNNFSMKPCYLPVVAVATENVVLQYVSTLHTN